MEKKDRKKRIQAMSLLDAACKRFEIERDLHSLDDEMIEQFLRKRPI